jgi:hypothetical protein
MIIALRDTRYRTRPSNLLQRNIRSSLESYSTRTYILSTGYVDYLPLPIILFDERMRLIVVDRSSQKSKKVYTVIKEFTMRLRTDGILEQH